MKTQAAKGSKLLSFAACVLAATALAVPTAEATRYLPRTLTPSTAPLAIPAADTTPETALEHRRFDLFSGVYPENRASGDSSSGFSLNLLERQGVRAESLWAAQIIRSLSLYDHRARFYDPGTLSFLEPDPLGPVDSPNLYQAFGFDAFNVTDPWGYRELTAEEKKRLGGAAALKEKIRREREETGTFTGAYLTDAEREYFQKNIGFCAPVANTKLGPEHYKTVLAMVDIETATMQEAVGQAEGGQPVVPRAHYGPLYDSWVRTAHWKPGVTDAEKERNYKIAVGIMLVTEEVPMMFAGRLKSPGGQLVMQARPAYRRNRKGTPTTPNAAARKAVQGEYIDPMTNKPVKASETLAADHVFPQSGIKQLPGYSNLSKELQSQVLNAGELPRAAIAHELL